MGQTVVTQDFLKTHVQTFKMDVYKTAFVTWFYTFSSAHNVQSILLTSHPNSSLWHLLFLFSHKWRKRATETALLQCLLTYPKEDVGLIVNDSSGNRIKSEGTDLTRGVSDSKGAGKREDVCALSFFTVTFLGLCSLSIYIFLSIWIHFSAPYPTKLFAIVRKWIRRGFTAQPRGSSDAWGQCPTEQDSEGLWRALNLWVFSFSVKQASVRHGQLMTTLSNNEGQVKSSVNALPMLKSD